MNRLFTNFLTTLFLMHTTFGCCVHHAHAYGTDGGETLAVAASACVCPRCVEDDASSVAEEKSLESDSRLPHPLPHKCERAECNLALVGSSPTTGLPKTDALSAAFSTPAADVALAAVSAGACVDLNFDSHSLRSHLLLSILLI